MGKGGQICRHQSGVTVYSSSAVSPSSKGRAMPYETRTVAPVTLRIGAEVEGITLAKPLSNRQVDELHQAWAEHQVLFFRDQVLDVENVRFMISYKLNGSAKPLGADIGAHFDA